MHTAIHPELSWLDNEDLKGLITILRKLRLGLAPFYRILPDPLSFKERKSLSALLGRLTPLYVRGTVRALRRPGSFDGMPFDAERLSLLQELADVLRNVDGLFSIFQGQVHDFYIYVQSAAQRYAMSVHEEVARQGASVFGPPEGHDLRVADLADAAMLGHQRGRKPKKRTRRRRTDQAE